MYKKLLSVRSLCISAVIAALYAALTILLAPISYGNIQCRVSEAMTLLPLITPAAIPGLFVGCLLANLYTGQLLDIIVGSLATLAAAIATYTFRKVTFKKVPIISIVSPVLLNGLIVGYELSVLFGLPLVITMIEVAIGESIAVALGYVLLLSLKKTRFDLLKHI